MVHQRYREVLGSYLQTYLHSAPKDFETVYKADNFAMILALPHLDGHSGLKKPERHHCVCQTDAPLQGAINESFDKIGLSSLVSGENDFQLFGGEELSETPDEDKHEASEHPSVRLPLQELPSRCCTVYGNANRGAARHNEVPVLYDVKEPRLLDLKVSQEHRAGVG